MFVENSEGYISQQKALCAGSPSSYDHNELTVHYSEKSEGLLSEQSHLMTSPSLLSQCVN